MGLHVSTLLLEYAFWSNGNNSVFIPGYNSLRENLSVDPVLQITAL